MEPVPGLVPCWAFGCALNRRQPGRTPAPAQPFASTGFPYKPSQTEHALHLGHAAGTNQMFD